MDKEKFLNSGLIEQFVLGITTPEETAEVERYAEAFPEIQKEIVQMRAVVENYAKQYAIDPPADVKDAILNEIDDLSAKSNPQASNNSWMRWLPMAAILASVILAFNFYKQKTVIQNELSATQDQLVALEKSCEEEKKQLQETQALYAYLTDKATKAVTIKGTDLSPNAEVVVYWNPEKENALLNIVNLPSPPPGKQYQMWADVEGEMIDMGIFNLDDPKLREMAFIQNAESLNITLEPEGGSDHPTVSLLQANGKIG